MVKNDNCIIPRSAIIITAILTGTVGATSLLIVESLTANAETQTYPLMPPLIIAYDGNLRMGSRNDFYTKATRSLADLCSSSRPREQTNQGNGPNLMQTRATSPNFTVSTCYRTKIDTGSGGKSLGLHLHRSNASHAVNQRVVTDVSSSSIQAKHVTTKPKTFLIANVQSTVGKGQVNSDTALNTLLLWRGGGHSLIPPKRGHQDSVTTIAFSPDGERIASGSFDGVLFWSITSDQAISSLSLGHTEAVTQVSFSPDSKFIVSASHDKSLRIWNAGNGQPLGLTLRGHGGSVWSAAFSPDGLRIVSGSADKTLRVWDASSGRLLLPPILGHFGDVRAVAFSPDGHRIVSASTDGTLRLWDAISGRPLGSPLRGHIGRVVSVSFSPDGRLIVSGSDDDTLRIWDANSGKQIGSPLQGHTDDVTSVAFSPDSRLVLSGSKDHTLRLWDSSNGIPISQPLRGHKDWVTAVTFSPDGSFIVSGSGDETVQIWSPKMNRQ